MENKTSHPIRPRSAEDDSILDEHPVAASSGAAAGLTAGAALGGAIGPVGAAIGAVVGTVVGAFAGDAVAERVDASAEDAYWRENHGQQPYAAAIHPFELCEPAYRVGYRGYREGKSFLDREAELRMEYEGGPQKVEMDTADETPRADSQEIEPPPAPGTMQYNMSTHPLNWEDAREAVRAAYERVAQRETRASVVASSISRS